jgi:hypothetical protein
VSRQQVEELLAATPTDPPMYRQVAAEHGPTPTQAARIDAWVKADFAGLPTDKQYNPRRTRTTRGGAR